MDMAKSTTCFKFGVASLLAAVFEAVVLSYYMMAFFVHDGS